MGDVDKRVLVRVLVVTQAAEDASKAEQEKEEQLRRGNPLLHGADPSFGVKRRWGSLPFPRPRFTSHAHMHPTSQLHTCTLGIYEGCAPPIRSYLGNMRLFLV